MKKIVYWISTIVVALAMVYSSYSELYSPAVKEAFVHLGFPDYFRIQLAIMKMIGIVLLLAPLPGAFREWAYVGFTITFVSAFIAHTMALDPLSSRMAPLIVLFFLLVSYVSFMRIKTSSGN